MPTTPITLTGARILRGLYTLFAISAGVRALYQILLKFQNAPFAYSLSAIAALTYLVAVFALRHRTPRAWRVTLAVCFFELFGVLIVGSLTIWEPQLFAAQSVWSRYGEGYGYVPLLLPITGLVWLFQPTVRQEYGVDGG